jgi:hypothetical protein
MEAHDEDWLLSFLAEFAAMSEEERDAAIDALPAQGRGALVALAEQRAATAATDLIEVLDGGQAGLDKLYEVTEPTDLFTVINLAVRETPDIVVEALFAAVVLHRNWHQSEPAGILALREGWVWHVHERVVAARESREVSDSGAPEQPQQ